ADRAVVAAGGVRARAAAGGLESNTARVSAPEVSARAVCRTGGPYTCGSGAGVRGGADQLRRVGSAQHAAGPLSARPGRGSRGDLGPVHGAQCRDGGGTAGDFESRGRLPATGPGVPGGTTA